MSVYKFTEQPRHRVTIAEPYRFVDPARTVQVRQSRSVTARFRTSRGGPVRKITILGIPVPPPEPVRVPR